MREESKFRTYIPTWQGEQKVLILNLNVEELNNSTIVIEKVILLFLPLEGQSEMSFHMLW